MSVSTEEAVLVEFADVLDQYASRQQELLVLLRRFRTSYLDTLPRPPAPASWARRPPPPARLRSVPVSDPGRPSPPSALRPVAEVHRHRPPPPVHLRPATPITPLRRPTLPGVPSVSTAPGADAGPPVGGRPAPSPWPVELLGGAVHATKRDYDYFSELDERLGHLDPTTDGAA